MNERVAPLYEILKLNSRLFLNCLDGMSEDQARWRPNADTNNATFIAMHMVDARCRLAALVGLKVESPFGAALKAAKTIDDIKAWPRLEEVCGAWKAVTGELRERFKQIGPDDLAKVMPSKYPTDDPTVLGAVAFLLHHDTYHLGMLSLLRKQVGLPAMTYREP